MRYCFSLLTLFLSGCASVTSLEPVTLATQTPSPEITTTTDLEPASTPPLSTVSPELGKPTSAPTAAPFQSVDVIAEPEDQIPVSPNAEVLAANELAQNQDSCDVFDDFTQPKSVFWQSVNDNVMGGRSIGGFTIENESLVLAGSINLNGGGFISVRAPLSAGALARYNAVRITAQSDGRGYAVTFRDSNRQRLSHRLALNLEAGDEWQTVTIPFTELEPAFFGEKVRAAGFNHREAREFGIILNDGLGGDYQLVIDQIEFCNLTA